jgi:hypothetical protein
MMMMLMMMTTAMMTTITKGVVRSNKSKDRQHSGHEKKGQKDKQRSTKHTHKI